MEKNKLIPSETLNKIFDAKLSDKDFMRASNFIQKNYGIKMPSVKKIMLQSRLQKRLKALGMTSYTQYLDFVLGKDGKAEIVNMMDVVSTNKTDFYREPMHFEFLKDTLLPEYYQDKSNGLFKVWSAGCSTGEEPYTIAIELTEFMINNAGFDFSIFGTDLSTKVLKKAIEAVYPINRVDVIPLDLKKKYLLKSKNKEKNLVKVTTALRKKVTYDRLNFMDADYKVNEMYDLIFCRNVLIYFDRKNQENIINKLCRNLKHGGYIFFGHSESITGIDAPLTHIKPTIFRRK